MAVEEMGARPFVVPRRVAPAREDGLPARFARGLSRALALDRTAGWEWGVAVIVLFLLARTPVLFMRQRLTGVLGPRTSELWQDDIVITATFAVIQLAVVAVAVRRVDASALVRQKMLLAFCAMVWLSAAWSVEPGVTARHSALFIATAAVGWYIGTRFSVRQQAALIVGMAAIGFVSSAIVYAIWPDIVYSTSNDRPWAGIFVNRNTLAVVMCMGLLGALFLAVSSRRGRPVLLAAAGAFATLIVISGSRTAPVAVVATFGLCSIFLLLRNLAGDRLTPTGGAAVLTSISAIGGMVIVPHIATIAGWLGRDPTLTYRTEIWHVASWFSREHPWQGWGLDAVWANRRAVGQAQSAYWPNFIGVRRESALGLWPFSAHNGFYETLVGVGRIGLLLLVCFLAVALWRAIRYAWSRRDVMSLWPFAFLVFAVVVNWGESLFIANEAVWALTVAAAIRVTESARDDAT